VNLYVDGFLRDESSAFSISVLQRYCASTITILHVEMNLQQRLVHRKVPNVKVIYVRHSINLFRVLLYLS
jgi:hypothetical protein